MRWVGHPQGDMHMVAASLGSKGPRLGPGGLLLSLHAWTGLEYTAFILSGFIFSRGKPAWALSRCLTTKSADYCMLINE